MRDLTVKALLSATLICAAAVPAWADLYDGLKAYEAGDYTTALKEFRPLAELGHAYAQHNLGVMYDEGAGVPENYAEAVKWCR
jgi:TPR repeat protein